MRSSSTSALLRSTGEHEPTYVRGRKSSEFIAHFSSGATVQVEFGRRRRYPGLAGPAPATQLCYRYFVEQGPRTGHILDVGCGAGVGLRWLMQAASARLTGVDCDGRAIAFARAYLPELEFIHADAESHRVQSAGCMAVLVDVLGMVADPVRFLRALAARNTQLEAAFVAEPEATQQQELIAPARRAFSPQILASVLVRAGYIVDRIDRLNTNMLCVIAQPSRERASDLLKQAEQAYLVHQSQSLIDACQVIRARGSNALKAEAMLLEAKLRFDLEQRDRAIALLSDARTLIPGDARPIAGLARLALTTGNHDQAVQLAEQAIQIDPVEPSVWCSLALAYMSEQHHRSMLAWETACALAPDDCLIAQMAYAAAFVEGRHSVGLALVERLGQYQGLTSRTNEHVALADLITAARRQYRSLAALKDSLAVI